LEARPETVVDQSRKLLEIIAVYVGKMPRDYKFTVGDRLLSRTLSILECVVEAYYSKSMEKNQLIRRANIHLEVLRQILRFCLEHGMHGIAKQEHFTREIETLGRTLGAWAKSITARNNA
jgi:hypothetical protein